MDRDLYRRRQRRRAIIAWSSLGIVVALVVLGAILGGGEKVSTAPAPPLQLFSSAMTSDQFEAIHKGESESTVLIRLHGVGLQEDQVEGSGLPGLFPARPQSSTCSYWTLSDAPGHLVRLCFSDPQGVLLEKSLVISGGESAPRTLA